MRSDHRDHPILERMAALRRTHVRLTTRWRAVRAIWVGLLGLLALVLVDAGWSLIGDAFFGSLSELTPGARGVMLTGWLIGVGALTAWAAAARRLRDRTLTWYGRVAEQRLGLVGNPLVNGLAILSDHRSAGRGFEHALRERVVLQADAAAGSVSSADVFDRSVLRDEYRRLGRVGLVWVIVLAAWMVWVYPTPPWRPLVRVLAPWVQTRPAGLTGFSLTISPDRPAVGDNVKVSVAMRGDLPEKITWRIEPTAEAATYVSAPVDASGEARLTLDRVDRAVAVTVLADGTRSDRLRVEPVVLPEIESVRVTLTPPGGDASMPVRYPRDEPVMALIDSTLRIEATASGKGVRIDHGEAEGLLLELLVTPGATRIDAAVINETGQRSRGAIRLAVVGLSPGELTDKLAADAAASPTSPADSAGAGATEASPGEPNRPPEQMTREGADGDGDAPESPTPAGDSPDAASDGSNPGAVTPSPDASGRGGTPTDLDLESYRRVIGPAARIDTYSVGDTEAEADWPDAVRAAPAAWRDAVDQYFRLLGQPLDATGGQP